MTSAEPDRRPDNANANSREGPLAPAVSIIIATYNRSNIVGYAIRSVLAQSRTDWELLVIGDGCTDDTAQVVAAFADPRVRYIEIDRVGDQSGPTNEGLRRARGRYVALLNHDDLWLPDHLEAAIATLEKSGADLAFSLQFEHDPDGSWRVNSVYPDGFDPIVHPNASAWVFRRELASRVGPLAARHDVYTYPTRDWLWRAARAGAKLVVTHAVTVVVISATTRRNVYSERQWREHENVYAMMAADSRFRERRLVDALHHPRPTHLRAMRLRVLLQAAGLRILGRAAQSLRVDPERVYCYYKFPKKWGFIPARGAVIAELYRRRGLDPEGRPVSGRETPASRVPPLDTAAQPPAERAR